MVTGVPAPAVAAASFFPGAARVRLSALLDELRALVEVMADDPVVIEDFLALTEATGLEPRDGLRREYAAVKLAFEATRDGGWWHTRWAITNRKPNSEAVWSQWAELEAPGDDDAPVVTATAECDELTALFAFVARRLGARNVGLFWPVWNHVVGVWSVTQGETTHRIVLPTSQIFLGPEDSFGTTGFNPWRQKTIYTYRRRDASSRTALPASLAEFMVAQAWSLAFLPQAEQQHRRNARSRALQGS
ncbi:MAG: hypothetical protein AAGA54_17735 [Myxococcota bacterium]